MGAVDSDSVTAVTADAALAAEAAGLQGKFWEMHDLLFANQPHLKLQQLRGYAERLQLYMARYTVEMDDHVAERGGSSGCYCLCSSSRITRINCARRGTSTFKSFSIVRQKAWLLVAAAT